MTDSKELFPIVTPDGTVIGHATRSECHSGSMLLHPVVHLHLVTPDGSLYLQKRLMTKDIQPGKWDTSVGGHVDWGETVNHALAREAAEELGYGVRNPRHLLSYVFESDRERELVNVFAETITAEEAARLTPSPDEIECGRLWNPAEINEATGTGVLTPNFEREYARIVGLLID